MLVVGFDVLDVKVVLEVVVALIVVESDVDVSVEFVVLVVFVVTLVEDDAELLLVVVVVLVEAVELGSGWVQDLVFL